MTSYQVLEQLYIPDQYEELTDSCDELMKKSKAIESYAQELENELLYQCAFEASNGEGSSEDVSKISAKFRSGFEKIKRGKKSKNQNLVSDGQNEIKEANSELKKAENEADTPEKKKKLSTVAKIAIAVGSATLLALLAFIGLKNRGKITALIHKLKRNRGTDISEAAADVADAATAAATAPVEDKPVNTSSTQKPEPPATSGDSLIENTERMINNLIQQRDAATDETKKASFNKSIEALRSQLANLTAK